MEAKKNTVEPLGFWKQFDKPPAGALKTIGGGRLKGMTDINPQWRYEAMTTVFGPCGIGWKYEIVRLWREEASQGQVFAFAEIKLFIKNDAQWSEPIPGIGGHMLLVLEDFGKRMHSNDEGYKMAITDALSVAMKALGVGAEIYAGRWDGSKYQERQNLPTQTPPPAKAAPAPQAPAPQAANKPRQATQAQAPAKAPPAAKAPVGGQKNGQAAQTKKAFVIDEKEQQTRGCINSTLVAELRQAVLAQQKANKLDPDAEFMPWVDGYLDMLISTPGMEAYTRKYKGTAQLLLDIPSTAYAEILERVQKEPESCKPGYAEATEQAQAQDDSGVV
jgi:hypothetical protein